MTEQEKKHSATSVFGPTTPMQDLRNSIFLRDYHRKYHPVINGKIKSGFCFGKDETLPENFNANNLENVL